jgi:hypothetical protein
MFGLALYFGTYESVVRYYTQSNRESADSLVYLKAGAVAGFLLHLCIYPIDSIKSNFQFGSTFREAVLKSLTLQKLKGYRVVLIRALLANAGGFWSYETAQRYVRFFDNYYYGMPL